MRTFKLNPPIVFDNDCLSCFLWTRQVDLLLQVMAGKPIVVPDQVVTELAHLNATRFSWVYQLLDHEIKVNNIITLALPAADPAAVEFAALTDIRGSRPMGSGEAAVLATVKFNGGTVASNNLADVYDYCTNHVLELISTDDILCLSVQGHLITNSQADTLWNEMLKRKRRLPIYGFAEAYRRFCMDEVK